MRSKSELASSCNLQCNAASKSAMTAGAAGGFARWSRGPGGSPTTVTFGDARSDDPSVSYIGVRVLRVLN